MDHLEQSSMNGFALGNVRRVSSRRKDESWIRERVIDPGARFIPFLNLKPLIDNRHKIRPAALCLEDLGRESLESAESVVFLGQEGQHVFFSVALCPDDTQLHKRLLQYGAFRELRETTPLLDASDAAILAYGRAMSYWRERNRFCGDCGHPTISVSGGHVLNCSNTVCGRQHFPRTDPAIIMLVSAGDRCLLGRQAAWPMGMYSTLAGFVEPGETLEAAVVREVREESGILVRKVTYHSSQPWPFPCSIMIGFSAEADYAEILLRDQELESAIWLTRSELAERVSSGALRLPTRISIAYRLIEHWFDSGSGFSLSDLSSLRFS